jgi:hypothetical protein
MLSGADQPATLRYELRFGATPTSPIGPPVRCPAPTPGHEFCPYQEPDYVPNYEKVVPQAIQSCGGSFVGFEAMTEGAELAIFSVDPDRVAEVLNCIKRRVPQGNVEAAGERH